MVGEELLRAHNEDFTRARRPQDPTPADGAVGTGLKEARPRVAGDLEAMMVLNAGVKERSHPVCTESLEQRKT